MKQAVVITGATGFLGSHLARQFLRNDFRVYAIIRPDSKNQGRLPVHEELIPIFCDLAQISECIEAIGSAHAWFHFAWGGVNREEIDSPLVQSRNIKESLECMKVADQLGCTMFMDAGSRVEYGITKETMAEAAECHPVNEYGKAKLKFYQEAKLFSKERKLCYYHLRFFSVYGYGDHPWSMIATLIRQLRKNQNVSLSACLHQWNFMYIDDAIEAVYQLYCHASAEDSSEIVNIASAQSRQLRFYVEAVRDLIGGQGCLNYGTFVQAKEGALSLQPDITKLYHLTKGHWQEQYSFRAGILETLRREMECANEDNQHFDSLL